SEPALSGDTVVVTEKSPDALSATNGTDNMLLLRHVDQLVAEPLMVAFAMVMGHEVGKCPPEMPFTERNEAVEAFFFNRSNEPFGVRVAVRRAQRRSNHSHPRRGEKPLDTRAH